MPGRAPLPPQCGGFAEAETMGVAYFLCRPPTLPLVCFAAPIPPAPFPSGEGGDFLFSYARGSAPCIPGVEPGRHWLCLWETGSLGFVRAPAPAGATGTRVVKTNCPRGTCMAETVSAASGLMPGCRGRSPRRNKLWDSPFPGGEERSASAGRGMGERNKAKGKVGRRPAGQATLWAPPTPAAPATCRASHPSGTCNAGSARAAFGSGAGMQGAKPLA